jgi:hypothetical protein
MTDPFTALKSPQMADMNADADDADADAGALGIEYFIYGFLSLLRSNCPIYNWALWSGIFPASP